MGVWRWEGLDKQGKRAKGAINASSKQEARKLIRAQGVRPKKIIAPSLLEFDISEWMIEKGFSKPFTVKELGRFTRQLSIMINAGIPIIQTLEILYKSEKTPTLKKCIQTIARDVSEGATISESMSKQKGFSKLYCNLVRAGEAGGILDTILDKLAIHMEKQEKTKAQIKSAMAYPAIVTLVGIGVIWGMMVFVVPMFVDMLKDTGQKPPFITQLVMDISHFFGEYTLIMAPSFVIGIFLLKAYITTPTGKIIFDKFMMKMPLFGGIVIKGNLSGLFRTLATMLTSGVSLIDSLDICIETVDSSVISQDMKIVRQKVVEGSTLTEPLLKIEYFPDMVGQMIKVGEQTGNIDDMLEKVSSVFEEEVNELIENMTKMIEPLIIVVLGGMIAAILVAMYLPMFMSAGGSDM